MPESLQDGKVGKFPIWALGIILAGAIVLFVFIRNRRAQGSTTTAQAPPSDPLYYEPGAEGVYGLPPGAIGDYLNADPTNPAYPVGQTPGGIPGPVTNVQWSRLAFDLLVSRGDDPNLVQRALAKYIRGDALDAAEQAVVNLALQLMGAPPEGLILTPPSSPTTPPPQTPSDPQTPGTPARRSVIVARYKTPNPPWNSTLSGIAQHFGVSLDQIKRANGFSPYGGRNPNIIFTGERIWVDP
jgi:hypothetical protein